MSLRESPIRRQPGRPRWLVPLLVGVAVVVVIGLAYGILSLVRSSDDPVASESAQPTPSPCVTQSVPASQALPSPSNVKVNVYNATEVPGLAGKTARALVKRGFVKGNVDNDPAGKALAGVGEIRFGPKAQARAELLKAYVPGAVLVPVDRKGKVVDLAVGDAFPGLAPQAEVDAALAAPTPVASGPGCPS